MAKKVADDTPRFFRDLAAWRRWLAANHHKKDALWVGFHKVGSKKPSITWPESVDGALCFGWIDGIRKTIDATSYRIRFTPRRPGSTWSAVNVRRMEALIADGSMMPAGLRAFEGRVAHKTGIYSYEQRKKAQLSPADESRFRANRAAWEFFKSRPPGYRQLATWWVLSAKQDATRQRRLERLIADSAAHQDIGPMRRKDARAEPTTAS